VRAALLRRQLAHPRVGWLVPLVLAQCAFAGWLNQRITHTAVAFELTPSSPDTTPHSALLFHGCTILFWLLLPVLLGLRRRFGELDLSLPVGGRTLLTTRWLAFGVAGLLPVAAATLAFTLFDPAGAATYAGFGVEAAGAFALAALLVHLPDAGRVEARAGLPFAAALVAAAVVVASTFWVRPPRVGALAGVAEGVLAAAGFAALLRRAPASFVLAADDAAPPRRLDGGRDRTPRATLHLWLLRRTGLGWRNLVLGSGSVLLVASVAFGGGSQLAYAPLAAWFLVMGVAWSLQVLREALHLPIPRRVLHAHVALPPLAWIALVLAAVAVADRLGRPRPAAHAPAEPVCLDLVDWDAAAQRPVYQVAVPVAAREVAALALPEPEPGPGGKTAAVEARRLTLGVPLWLANPYAVEPSSTADFVAWQLARALRATYGADVPADAIRERYLAVRDDGIVRPRDDVLLRDLFGLGRPATPGAGPAAGAARALLGVLGWGAVLALAGWTQVLPSTRAGFRRRRACVVALVVGVAAAFGLTFAAAFTGRFDVLDLLRLAHDRVAGLLPASRAAAWALVAAAAAVIYAASSLRFARLEAPPPLPARSFGRAAPQSA